MILCRSDVLYSSYFDIFSTTFRQLSFADKHLIVCIFSLSVCNLSPFFYFMAFIGSHDYLDPPRGFESFDVFLS